MLVIRQKMIYRRDLKENPHVLYVFGDNLERTGYGGQAKEIRGEPNAFGIATKKKASHGLDALIFDGTNADAQSVRNDFERLKEEIESGKWKAVVLPTDGIGTGLARLSENAPKLLQYINEQFELLKGL